MAETRSQVPIDSIETSLQTSYDATPAISACTPRVKKIVKLMKRLSIRPSRTHQDHISNRFAVPSTLFGDADCLLQTTRVSGTTQACNSSFSLINRDMRLRLAHTQAGDFPNFHDGTGSAQWIDRLSSILRAYPSAKIGFFVLPMTRAKSTQHRPYTE